MPAPHCFAASALHAALRPWCASLALTWSCIAPVAWADPATKPVSEPATAAATACTPPAEAPVIATWRALAPDLWWLPGAAGDTDADNRGAISNLLLLIDGPRTWLVGAGPSAAHGQALAADIRCRFGREVTDVIAPWPRPELVLGQAGLDASVRRHAHADVAGAMAERCAHCAERLAQRLGRRATDLGEPASIALPTERLSGESGRLGPWHWWRVARSAGTPTTLWWHPASGVIGAHGLSWTDGAPDLRDADLDGIEAGVAQMQAIGDTLPAGTRWLPEQGPIDASARPEAQRAYWQALREAVTHAQAAGVAETDPPPERLPGVAATLTRGERHALNWQRTWRELEARAFDAVPAGEPVPPGVPKP
ncbi:hypothetical protein [Leptothrix discophora]|uniref:hypothetical protein n=1 Tax=Leptothrix discophora TaxID=89 RepID=UPI002737E7D9|nr:hypothetical protein [Leptothrix discophora]